MSAARDPFSGGGATVEQARTRLHSRVMSGDRIDCPACTENEDAVVDEINDLLTSPRAASRILNSVLHARAYYQHRNALGALADLADQAFDAVLWDEKQEAKRLLRQIAAALRGEGE